MASSKIFMKVQVGDKMVDAVISDETLNQYIEKDEELLEFSKQEKAKAYPPRSPVKAKDIKVPSDGILSESDIRILCIHGVVWKVTRVDQSCLSQEFRSAMIQEMKNTLNYINEWMKEDYNLTVDRQEYFKKRRAGIFKIMKYFRSF